VVGVQCEGVSGSVERAEATAFVCVAKATRALPIDRLRAVVHDDPRDILYYIPCDAIQILILKHQHELNLGNCPKGSFLMS
jgi:hypothetical protein